MSLMGIDVGTTGCKAAVFDEAGTMLSLQYREYDVARPQPRTAELDASAVWEAIKEVIRGALSENGASRDLRAISVASMGENLVPVSRERRILGPSILNVDYRGEEYLAALRTGCSDERLYQINGNTWGNQYSLPKLMWIREHQPQLYEETYKFLHWGGFVTFMLGSEPHVDYALANRSLLFDLDNEDWSEELLALGGIDREKLPRTVASGVPTGHVDGRIAQELGIPAGLPLVNGSHDQCANALGCGVTEAGMAMYGMGTFPTIVPVYDRRPDQTFMIGAGLNTEHHAVPGRFVSFIFHMGGSAIKWYRDTFAAEEHRQARERGENVYERLFREMPDQPSDVLVLPRFAPMGPPDFEDIPNAAMMGLSLETTRGEILKGIVEGNTLAHSLVVENLPEAGIDISEYTVVGGGSRSDNSVQIAADILGRPMVRSNVVEAGAFGAALLAGLGIGTYGSFSEAAGIARSVSGQVFEPDPQRHQQYREKLAAYRELRGFVARSM
ncbi:MAG: hypothetical protein EA427_05210 [Spirochaetaceae bacterium]|nr:MAG: hypothetical protein EA427_05210 [Spirochaetaceae bacterium]